MKLVPTKKKKKEDSVVPNKNQINLLVKEYSDVSEKMKLMDSQKKKLSKQIKEYSKEHGVVTDTGYSCENDQFSFGMTVPKSTVLKEDAVAILKNAGYNGLIKSQVVYTIDEESLTDLWKNGEISDETVQSLYNVVPGTPRVFVKKLEELPEITQVAAKRKK